MKKNKQKFWFFDPEEHGGEGNMYLYFFAIGIAILGFVIQVIKKLIVYYAE